MQVTNEIPTLSFKFDKAEQVPHQCLLTAKILESQPLFTGQGQTKSKVVALDSYDNTRILGIFNSNARKFIGEESAWQISEFGGGNNHLWDAKGKHIKQGLNLWLYDSLERCSLETLEHAYSYVYDAMRKGWVESNPEDYQDIMFKQDPEKFTLFVKKRHLEDEDHLIRFLSGKFGLEGQVKCHLEWLKEDINLYFNDQIYMWVEKKVLPTFIVKFGLELAH